MTNDTSPDKDFLSWLKRISGGIAGIIGFVTLTVSFINLWAGNKSIVTDVTR